MQLKCMCSCLGAREKESPSHMHFGHCWTLFGVWCSVALFGSVVPEGRRSCAVVSADRGPEGRGRGVPQGYQVSLFSHGSTISTRIVLVQHVAHEQSLLLMFGTGSDHRGEAWRTHTAMPARMQCTIHARQACRQSRNRRSSDAQKHETKVPRCVPRPSRA